LVTDLPSPAHWVVLPFGSWFSFCGGKYEVYGYEWQRPVLKFPGWS
jgi:hypothetical protein